MLKANTSILATLLGVLMLVLAILATGAKAEAQTCNPPQSGGYVFASKEIGKNAGLELSDSGSISGLRPGVLYDVVVEAHSDAEYGCGGDQEDETASVSVNGHTVIVTHPETASFSVVVQMDGRLHIEATSMATETPGSMFIIVRVVGEKQLPTETPTEEPTEEPTETPTETPTEVPTEEPTETPTPVITPTPTETQPAPRYNKNCWYVLNQEQWLEHWVWYAADGYNELYPTNDQVKYETYLNQIGAWMPHFMQDGLYDLYLQPNVYGNTQPSGAPVVTFKVWHEEMQDGRQMFCETVSGEQPEPIATAVPQAATHVVDCNNPIPGAVTCDQDITWVVMEYVVGNPDPAVTLFDVQYDQIQRAWVEVNGKAVADISIWDREDDLFPDTVSGRWLYEEITLGDDVWLKFDLIGMNLDIKVPVVDAADGFGNPEMPAMITADNQLVCYPGNDMFDVKRITQYQGDAEDLKQLCFDAHIAAMNGGSVPIPEELMANMALFNQAARVAADPNIVTWEIQSGDSWSSLLFAHDYNNVYGEDGIVNQCGLQEIPLIAGQAVEVPQCVLDSSGT